MTPFHCMTAIFGAADMCYQRCRRASQACTCSSEPSFVVVKEMCSCPMTISSSCRPTRSGTGQLLSSSFMICSSKSGPHINQP